MILTIYRVRPDTKRYQSLAFEDAGFSANHKFDGDSYEADWTPPQVRIQNPHLEAPDFWSIDGKAAFALTWDLYLELPVIDPAGEILPMSSVERNFRVLNVTNVINCLDEDQTAMNSTTPGLIEQYAFLPQRLNRTIFKIMESSENEILTVEGMMGPVDEFKPTVQSRKLKGLLFEKIWSER